MCEIIYTDESHKPLIYKSLGISFLTIQIKVPDMSENVSDLPDCQLRNVM